MYFSLNSIIISRQPFREDDLLVTAYSKERGKLTLVARGAKKIKSKLAGHLEPVSLSFLEIARGKKLDQLIGAQTIKSYARLKNNLEAVNSAGRFLRLIDDLVHENHADAKIFYLLEKYLDFLESGQNNYQISWLAAGFKLLQVLGLNPAVKLEQGMAELVNFIVKNDLKSIALNQKVATSFSKLDKILIEEINEHLPQKR